MVGWWRRRFGSSSRAPRHSARIQLRVERLEELLLMSAIPIDDAYDQWRRQTFTIGGADVEITAGALADGPVGQANQGLQLIGGVQARQQYGYTGTGYTVAILDTGLDYNHPALSGRYLGGWDFVDNDSNPMDENGHGTHVAGIIGSSDATYGGVAPNVNFVALRVLDEDGAGSFGDVESALRWIADHRLQYNIVAVNMSLGVGNFVSAPWHYMDDELSSLKSQGVFVAAAAGNSFYSYGSQQGLGYPAINDLTVSVGAVWDGAYGTATWSSGAKDLSTAADRVASFSQRSSQLELMAPGAYITSTWMGGGFSTMAGTSMAAPMVTGAAVLIHQALEARGQGNLANRDHILSVMRSTGATIVDGDDENDNVTNTGLTFKRLDLYAALRSIVSTGTPSPSLTPPPAPTPSTPAPSMPSPLNPNAAFVSGLYREVLGRAVDAAGLKSWTNALQSGMSRAQLAHALWVSAEHRNLEISQFYTGLLDRTPSEAERNDWIGRFQAGATETDVLRALLNSPEYSSSHASNVRFVNGVYSDLLGRAADVNALNSWLGNLQAGVSRGALIDFVLGSNERTGHVVGGYYREFLSRSASAAETSDWLTAVGRGHVALPGVAEMFLSSDEYFNRALSAGGASNLDAGLADARDALVAWPSDDELSWQEQPAADTPREQAFHELWTDGQDADAQLWLGAASSVIEGEGEFILRSASHVTRRLNESLDRLMEAIGSEDLTQLA